MAIWGYIRSLNDLCQQQQASTLIRSEVLQDVTFPAKLTKIKNIQFLVSSKTSAEKELEVVINLMTALNSSVSKTANMKDGRKLSSY